MNKPYSVCPFCASQNPISIITEFMTYKCKTCGNDYVVKREVNYITITPGLLKEEINETVRSDD